MSVPDFLNAVLPSKGLRFGLASLGEQGDPDFRPGQRAFPEGDTDQLVGYLAQNAQQGRNAFFAVAGFDRVTDPEDPHQRPRRLAHAAQYHRCLRLDIDTGPDKDYADKRAALTALLSFNARFRLTKPFIVDSGSGFHVYYPFDRDLTLVEWKLLAARLRSACVMDGLRVDSTTTEDAARILRLPGTPNNKRKWKEAGLPNPLVRILQVGVPADPDTLSAHLPEAVAEEIRGLAFANLTPGMAALIPLEMRALVGNKDMGSPYTAYTLRGVLTQCPGMAAMVANGGALASEPLWMHTLTLVNKSDDPMDLRERVARAISCKHPDFTEAGFGAKWQQVQRQSYHPPQCSKLASLGMPECNGCPLRGSIASPIALGYPAPPMLPVEGPVPPAAASAGPAAPADTPAAAAPVPPLVPAAGPAFISPAQVAQVGVFQFTSGQSEVRVVDGVLTTTLRIVDGYPVILRKPREEGGQPQPERLLEYKILAVERMMSRGGDTRAFTRITLDAAFDGHQQIMFTDDELGEKGKFNNKLRRHSIYVKPRLLSEFHEGFLVVFLQQLQRNRAAHEVATRCGWSADRNAFTLGNSIYHRDGRVETVHGVASNSELAAYSQAGDLTAWRDAFDITLQGGPDRQVVLALAIAGPLMPFTGVDGVMFNAYSPESGVGKSTLCDAALSVWGSPDGLRKDFRDTPNATFQLATISGNMPLVVDEFTNVEGKHLSDYVYTLTQGREKHRLGADAKLQAPGDRWCLLALATSNNSVHEKLQRFREAATAEAARVFEMRLHPLNVPAADMGQIKHRLSALKHSYGFLGPQLVSLFMSKPASYWQELVTSRIAKWDSLAAATTGDRFRSVVCALAEIGAALGTALGYGFDKDGVDKMLLAHWTKQVTEFERERKTPADFLNDYLTGNVGNFISMSGPNCDQPGVPPSMRVPAGEILNKPGETKFTPHTMVVPVSMLRDHVRKSGDWKQFYEWLQSSGLLLREASTRIFTATTTPVTTMCFFLDHPKLSGALAKAAAAKENPQCQQANSI